MLNSETSHRKEIQERKKHDTFAYSKDIELKNSIIDANKYLLKLNFWLCWSFYLNTFLPVLEIRPEEFNV